MSEVEKPKSVKEVDVFNRFSHLNKLKTIFIASAIAIVSFCVLYFFCKSLITYTITYETNGGLVYGQPIEDDKYKFLQKTKAPVGLKKMDLKNNTGYYIVGYYTDPEMKNEYTFGKSIWRSLKLYVKWEEGHTLELHYAEGEAGKTNLKEDYIRIRYEQYCQPGTEYTLPLVYNTEPYLKEEGVVNHEGEQLLWFEDKSCSGNPISVKTYTIPEDTNIKLYGKWFDTREEKFEVSDDGVLQKYLGYCENIVLPSKVKAIKDIDPLKYNDSSLGHLNDDPKNLNAFANIKTSLKSVYINEECERIGNCSFRSCDKLEKVGFLGNKVEAIGQYAFAGCLKLDTLTVPSSVKTLETNAFYKTEALLHIKGMEGVETIGSGVFMNSAVKELEFKNLKSLGASAFSACYGLTQLIIRSYEMAVAYVPENDNERILYGSTDACVYVPQDLFETYKTTAPWDFYFGRGQLATIESLEGY